MAVPELPRLPDLSDPQIRGAACVWCGVGLIAGQVVDLGERPCRWLTHKASWFPRACTSCAGRPAEETMS
ncbi:hypothetical protein B1H18_29020 [Streptomyces tsukubensis]|uniref:Uncharacterized protein n=1 Tax=Streptomyces tsukubensis TaxID=83656 RepID=A0A1V4A0Z1_9ACTN|nr:hypothetical protein B1H18_29020 [Streptomyces tsukubensis]